MNQEQTEEAVFRDTRGRDWRLELNVTLAKDIRKATGLDLINWHDGKALIQLQAKDELLVQVLWYFVSDQAEAEGVGEEEFGSALGGNALEAAMVALEVALLNFSRPSRRAMAKVILDRTREEVEGRYKIATEKFKGKGTTQAIAKGLSKVGAEIDRLIEKSATSGK